MNFCPYSIDKEERDGERDSVQDLTSSVLLANKCRSESTLLSSGTNLIHIYHTTLPFLKYFLKTAVLHQALF